MVANSEASASPHLTMPHARTQVTAQPYDHIIVDCNCKGTVIPLFTSAAFVGKGGGVGKSW